MAIDVQISVGLDIQVDQPMARDLVEHMVKKTDAGVQARYTRAIQVDPHRDLGLGRDTGNLSGTGCGGVWQWETGHRDSCRAASNKRFSSTVPTVRRRQLAKSGCRDDTFLTSTLRCFSPTKQRSASGTRSRIMLASLG